MDILSMFARAIFRLALVLGLLLSFILFPMILVISLLFYDNPFQFYVDYAEMVRTVW